MSDDWLTCLACSPDLAAVLAQDPALAAAWAALPRRSLAAGQALLAAGAPVQAGWFVEQGLARCLVANAHGRERNIAFHAEGDWIGAALPPGGGASRVAVEAIEPLRVTELAYPLLSQWQRTHPLVARLLDNALRCAFERQLARQADLLLRSATERYQDFVARHPSLAARLPQHQLALHLGITEVGLSRIRARLGLTAGARRQCRGA